MLGQPSGCFAHIQQHVGFIGFQRLKGIELRCQQRDGHKLVVSGGHTCGECVHGAFQVQEQHLRGVLPQEVAVTALQGGTGNNDPAFFLLI
jgi:hypothetical protein